MTRKFHLSVFASLLLTTTALAAEPFVQPAELQPDVDFWISIFAEYDSSQGVLHDNRNLGIVYEQIDLPATLGRRDRQRQVGVRRKAVQAVLNTLAAGKRESLTGDEARILALWPDDVSNATLQRAARQIRYQQGLSDRFATGLARSGRWRSYIEQELEALGVPAGLVALPHVESSFNPDARSHVGASGIWQFTRSTGRRFMRIDHVIDERNDPFAATRAAAQLLAHNYSIAGNWPMAVTAYNHGLGGVRRAMREYGDTAYVEILRNYDGRTFGFASRNFYVAFLAAHHVDQNREQYFPQVQLETPRDYVRLELPDYIAVRDLSEAIGVSPAALAAHNPALQPTVWQGSKHLPRDFELRVPGELLAGGATETLAAVSADAWQPRQLPDLFHTVARGDTLSQIAEAYDTRVSTLVALNSLSSSNRIRAGQRLRLPAAGPVPEVAEPAAAAPAAVEAAVVANIDPVEAEIVEELTPATLSGEAAAAPGPSPQTALLSDPSDYSVADNGSIEVHPLETLGHYADWLGIRTQRLRDLNGLAFRTPVEVGQRIRLGLADADRESFENQRVAFHRAQQDAFFREHVISGVIDHEIRPGESIWILALRQYDVPIWLFRQYNPSLVLDRVRPGTTVRFPVLTTAASG